MSDIKYQFESLLNAFAFSDAQREFIHCCMNNRACDPCDCDIDGPSCRCN